ncbi:unnamed protein product [Parnassius apollo]|uniref:(apollo) hypothetical protein n=1 Tax=Parnassius apollo TaxID=110799 RepID=A0A8S3W9Z3_PARAO|nr:unnamed protein product [Parnassius apollo]
MAEFQVGKFLSDLDDVYGRTARITCVSESTIRRIVDEGMQNGGKIVTPGKHRQGRPKKQIDDFDLCAIRQKVHFFYTVQKEVPTLRKLLAVVKEELNFDGSHEFLRQVLISIDFKFKKCQTNRLALIEKPVIALKCEYYLKHILENRKLPKELQKALFIWMRATYTSPTKLLNVGSLLIFLVSNKMYLKGKDG